MNDPFDMLTVDHSVSPAQFSRVRKYPKLWAWLLKWLQRKCQHYAMKADILEGCSRTYSVRWCETCGAVWPIVNSTPTGNPRLCEPTWE